jgi:hypothetical protein
MGRKIIRQSQAKNLAPSGQPDNYADRLVKMIPAEIVSLYLFLQSYISGNGHDYNWLLWIVVSVLAILTPLYLYRIMKVDDWVQMLLTTFAFLCWCLTFGAPFDDLIHDTGKLKIISTVLLSVYTFAIPIFYK